MTHSSGPEAGLPPAGLPPAPLPRYELFLRRDEPLTSEEVASARTQARDADLQVEVFQRDGRTCGFDLGVGLHEPSRSAEALCSVAFELARHLGLSVFDPQLGRTLAVAESEALLKRFAQSAGYLLTGFGGPPFSAPSRPPSTRIWLLLLGLLLLVAVAGRAFSCVAAS